MLTPTTSTCIPVFLQQGRGREVDTVVDTATTSGTPRIPSCRTDIQNRSSVCFPFEAVAFAGANGLAKVLAGHLLYGAHHTGSSVACGVVAEEAAVTAAAGSLARRLVVLPLWEARGGMLDCTERVCDRRGIGGCVSIVRENTWRPLFGRTNRDPTEICVGVQ